jgi:hypothetical protein
MLAAMCGVRFVDGDWRLQQLESAMEIVENGTVSM